MKFLVSVKSVKKSNKLNIIVAKWDIVVYWWVLQIFHFWVTHKRKCDANWNYVPLRNTLISQGGIFNETNKLFITFQNIAHTSDYWAEAGIDYERLCERAELCFIFYKIHNTGWMKRKITYIYSECLDVAMAAYTP